MGLALLVTATADTSLANGEELTLFGYANGNSATARSQVSCTEAATFSVLGARILSGNSGTATFRFFNAGAAGNQTFQITGVGTNEDATNTDSVAAAAVFNISYTDTGTDSGQIWQKGNVSFASGHGNFHGSADMAAPVFDVESATRFIGLAGNLTADGNATEANTQWKNRGYTSFEAFQVRVLANARTNTSDFRNRINGADGSLIASFAAGATGLVSDTSPADTLSDGDLVNASITLSTGVEDLTATFVAGTFKSSSSKSEIWAGAALTLARTASATAHYIPIGGQVHSLTAFSEANARIKVGFAAVVSNLRCYLTANTYTGNGTLKLYQNGVAVLTTTITASGGAAWYENASDTITIDDNDELSFEFDEGTSGTINIAAVGITFASVAVSELPILVMQPMSAAA